MRLIIIYKLKILTLYLIWVRRKSLENRVIRESMVLTKTRRSIFLRERGTHDLQSLFAFLKRHSTFFIIPTFFCFSICIYASIFFWKIHFLFACLVLGSIQFDYKIIDYYSIFYVIIYFMTMNMNSYYYLSFSFSFTIFFFYWIFLSFFKLRAL